MTDILINFAFQNWNNEYNWYHPNTIPLDFIVDGEKIPPISHNDHWFKHNNYTFLNKLLEYDLFSLPAKESDFLCNYKNVRYFLYSDLGDKKYIFPIMIHTFLYIQKNKLGFDLIDDKIIEDVKNNRAKIVLICPFEGFSGQDEGFADDFEIINDWCNRRELKKDHVFYIHGNHRRDKILEHYNFTYITVSIFTQWLKTKVDTPIEYEPIDNKNLFLSYNRRWDWHRLLFVCELLKNNIMDRGLVSFYGKTTWTDKLNSELIEPRFDLKEAATIIDSMIPMELDIDLLKNNPVSEIIRDHHASTFLSVTNETLWRSGTIFYSEKTFKPILAGQPFMIIGTQDMMKQLRNQGYQTFDKWWSEDYDSEPDIEIRVKMVIEELLKLSRLSLEELKNMRKEMMPVLKHNQDLFNFTRDKIYNGGHDDPLYQEIKKIWNSF
jgi:hypothetical protein